MTLLIMSLVLLLIPAPLEDQKKVRKEEHRDYFKKWLDEDVKYIITPEEKSVFKKLTTPEEKEAFVEQFWQRRDPDPRTAINEFKEEHYRRIAYANERFQSGKPGWMTDRGRVYIIHGEPEYIERYPSGGPYQRKASEGGGGTYTYPFEIWHYRHIDGVGDDVDLEFVDSSMSGEYRLALRPEEKDMLLYISGTAPTILEATGHESGRVDRPYFNPGLENNAAWRARHHYTAKDTPFARYARYAGVQRPPKIKFHNLKQVVETNINYSNFPFLMRTDFVRIGEDQVLAPITIQVENRELTFRFRNGVHTAKANIYGIIRNLSGKIVAEFEDSVVAEYKPEFLERGRQIPSVYQKMVLLKAGARYRVDVVVRDENSRRVGVAQKAIIVPSYRDENNLSTSSLILSKWIQPAPADSGIQDRFVLGDIKIIPSVTDVFRPEESLGAYLQVYNVELDQATLEPDVRIHYVLRRGREVLQEFQDNGEHTVQYYSSQRLVLIRQIPLKNLKAGEYRIEVEVEDRVGNRKVSATGRFTVAKS